MRWFLIPALAWLALSGPAWGQTDIQFPCRIVDYQNSAKELTRRCLSLSVLVCPITIQAKFAPCSR